jgi:S1-C subfamily serine protease
MPLKRHHKIIIGSAGSFILIFMVLGSVFMYTMAVKQNVQFNVLTKQIDDMSADSQSKFNELSISILKAETELKSLGAQVGSIDSEITDLKASASADFSGIIEDAVKSVVTIRTDLSQGSGFVIADDGYIVTNAHVMEGAKAAEVITYDGNSHEVSLVGTDIEMDVALLKISDNYPILILGDSNDVQVGEKVIAIGNPLGLQFSVSEGIVSAVHREGINGIEAYVQTDAALNPGNSGGPLINKQGEAIGINNFKVGNSESLGFALESDYLKDAVNGIYQEKYSQNLI